MSPYSSPIMLVARKNSSLKRIITDFSILNSRLQRLIVAIPLIRDAFATFGRSKCKCLSVLDLKDTYHTIKLLDNYKPYYGILPYFGSANYVYQRKPMGLSVSPVESIA